MTASETRSGRTISSPGRARWLAAVLVAGLALTTGCTSSGAGGRTGGEDRGVSAGELRLVAFDSCDDAVEELRAAALAHVGPWGFGGAGGHPEIAAEAADGPLAAAPDLAAPADGAAGRAGLAATEPAGTAPAQEPAHSGTNVHEAGVDEPDLVKTDGKRIVTVAGGVLRVVDVQRRTEIGAVALPGHEHDRHSWQPADLLLHGDRALVLMNQSWFGPMPEPWPAPMPGQGRALEGDPVPEGDPMPEPIAGPKLVLVDIAAARVLGEYVVDGSLVDARAVGPTVRVVVRSGARLDFPTLDHRASERQRLRANRDAVRAADLTDWLPRYQVTAGGTTHSGQVACTSLTRPAEFSGTSMLTVLTFDLSAGVLGDGAPVSVVADGDTVYSNGQSLYVTSDQRWRAVPDAEGGWDTDGRTEIYKFDVSQPGPPRYVAAGAVDGWLINQYGMSEWDGHLRVATTSGDVWWWRTDEPDSESTVYVLAERDGALVETGSVGGLGYGERIYSVRYVGPVGYVVTFRETDPLYTLDLRDPSAPAVLGELKITGYSAYLHPVDDDHVLGIGQEADLRGVVQGTQLSLFDVSDLTEPRLQATHHVRSGHSEAEFDPHAFLWWPAEQIVVVPLTVPVVPFDRGDGRDGSDRAAVPESGALVLRLDDGDFTELDLISHPDDGPRGHAAPIRRSLVIGDTLWTVSPAGLQANRLPTLETTAWIPFH